MKLSIITINLNNKDGLEKTIQSIVGQSVSGFEWIVIDGGSTDGSKELIEEYSSFMTYWVSEPDNGIYNAMNKGIKLANGDYLLFLNSGDIFYGSSVIENILLRDSDADEDFIIYDILLFNDNKQGPVKKNMELLEKMPIALFLYQNTFPHQSTLIKNDIFVKYGLYDESLKYVADWSLFFKACVFGNAKFRYNKNLILSVYDMNGVSSVLADKVMNERRKVIAQKFPEKILNVFDRAITLEYVNLEIQKNKIIRFLFKLLLWSANKITV